MPQNAFFLRTHDLLVRQMTQKARGIKIDHNRPKHCDLSRLLARKITKRIHSSKSASLNRPIVYCTIDFTVFTRVCCFAVNDGYWAIQAGLLTPLTFARHHLSPLAAFTSGAYFLDNGRQ